MKAYRAVGSFRARKTQQDFSHDLVALDQDDAKQDGERRSETEGHIDRRHRARTL